MIVKPIFDGYCVGGRGRKLRSRPLIPFLLSGFRTLVVAFRIGIDRLHAECICADLLCNHRGNDLRAASNQSTGGRSRQRRIFWRRSPARAAICVASAGRVWYTDPVNGMRTMRRCREARSR